LAGPKQDDPGQPGDALTTVGAVDSSVASVDGGTTPPLTNAPDSEVISSVYCGADAGPCEVDGASCAADVSLATCADAADSQAVNAVDSVDADVSSGDVSAD
jgi:hypothetical protein